MSRSEGEQGKAKKKWVWTAEATNARDVAYQVLLKRELKASYTSSLRPHTPVA
jgi:hypothetical protein